MLVENL